MEKESLKRMVFILLFFDLFVVIIQCNVINLLPEDIGAVIAMGDSITAATHCYGSNYQIDSPVLYIIIIAIFICYRWNKKSNKYN